MSPPSFFSSSSASSTLSSVAAVIFASSFVALTFWLSLRGVAAGPVGRVEASPASSAFSTLAFFVGGARRTSPHVARPRASARDASPWPWPTPWRTRGLPRAGHSARGTASSLRSRRSPGAGLVFGVFLSQVLLVLEQALGVGSAGLELLEALRDVRGECRWHVPC